MASGEASVRPSIHIWDVRSLEPLRILKTFHKNGILQTVFSEDGEFIISLGMDKNYR